MSAVLANSSQVWNMNKKRMISALAALLVCVSAVYAQYSEIYSSAEAAYADGVELYMQGKWGASERALNAYKGKTHEGQRQFYLAANAFEMRRKDARRQLQAYMKQNTYTPYASEVHFMLGTLLVEQNKNKQALREFEKVHVNELFRPHQADFHFYRGYAFVKMNEPQKAASSFGKLKEMNTRYNLQAKYYYAYCQYSMQNYGRALPEFLAIEKTETYKDIVPYYIIQIYYSQGQFDEVQSRAEQLLENDKDNPNNGELHRMIGEIYYRQEKYQDAVDQLSVYDRQIAALNKEPERSDMYLLGMSYYRLEDWHDAISYLLKVKKQDDELTQNTCYHLGNAYMRINDTQAAKMAYAAAMRYDYDSKIREEAMYNYALTTYNSSSALGESVTAFTDFLKEYPQSEYKEHIYELLCDAFTKSKNYASALEALNSIESPTPQMQQTKQYLRYQLGADAYMQGKNEEAERWFTEVIDNDVSSSTPTDKTAGYKTESYFMRAESRYKSGDYAGAEQDLRTMLKQPDAKKSSNYGLVNYSLGYTLFAQKKYSEALTCFTDYTKTADPQLATYSDAMNRAGDCYFNARRFVEAESCYAKVASAAGAGADYAIFQRGYALGLMKRYSEKISVLESLVKKYPKSDYADDALYEMARAELQRNNNQGAISAYEELLKSYPRSNMARKAALEKAMIYYNDKQYAKAIDGYKQVIKSYPGSEEAYSALDGLEAAYIETDNVAEYLAYTKSLGRINMKTDAREDSLTYVAAERQYMLQNYTQAIAGLSKYITQYCSGGRYCTTAQYYLADSYYRSDRKDDAMREFKALADISGNQYMEEALTRVAEISYDKADYKTALTYFSRLQTVAGKQDKVNAARLGVLRCSYYLGDHPTTVNVASEILVDNSVSSDLRQEAAYNRAKAYIALGEDNLAINDLRQTSSQVRTASGAESKYLLAEIYFKTGDLDGSEAQIMEFASMNTQQQYWLARSFVLLSDIYVKRGDLFQAKQYLLSLKQNYRTQDDVQTMVEDKLKEIETAENAKQVEEDDDEE